MAQRLGVANDVFNGVDTPGLVRRQQRGVVLSYRSAVLNMTRIVVPSCQVVSPLQLCPGVVRWADAVL
jgi:hypothetical protein